MTDNSTKCYPALPPELVKRVVDFLGGAWVTTFEHEFDEYNDEPLRLTKRETSRCSLTCRYWARSLRSGVVGSLTLQCRGEAEALICFARSKACGPDLHISPRVRNVQIDCKSSDVPWMHLLFMARDVLPHINLIYAEMTLDRPLNPRPSRSFHSLLPKDLPPSLMTITKPEVLAKHPIRIEDLTALVCSARPFSSQAWPAPSRERALPHQWTFRKVSFIPGRPEAMLNAIPRSYVRKIVQTVNLEHCAEPWLFARAFISVRQPRRSGAETSTFFIDPWELAKVEDVLAYLSKDGCECAEGAQFGHGLFKLQLLSHGEADTGFSLTYTCECRKHVLSSIKFAVSALGAISHVELVAKMRDVAPSSTAAVWNGLDKVCSKLDGVKTIAVCLPAHLAVGVAELAAVETVVRSSMTEIAETGRLELYRDDSVKGHVRIPEAS